MLVLLLLGCLAAPTAAPAHAAPAARPWVDPSLPRLLAAVRADGDTAWRRLADLCDTAGPRPAGSDGYLAAVAWTSATFRADGIPTWTELLTEVPWHRGEERLTLLAPQRRELALLGLGGSVGTPGVEAPVVVAHALDDIGPEVAGKIVLFNVPMAPSLPSIRAYGEVVGVRWGAAGAAAHHGAVAALVRSVTARSLYTPHTGGMGYTGEGPRIPAAAITPEDADWIERVTARGEEVRVRLEMGARTGAERLSANVVAELRGSERPDEVVLIGAHLDSWDVGQGAHDDGSGVIEVMEAMRHIAALGVPPRRTIRAVLFANEEKGLSGGRAYAEAHAGDRHVVAMETDLGGGGPRAWGVSGTPAQEAWVEGWLRPLGLPIEPEGGGADIGPVAKAQGVVTVGWHPDDTHYFDVHHTHADTVDKVDPDALREATALIAGFAWQAATAP